MGRLDRTAKGFYTVHIEAEEGIKIPYVILATSDDNAAERVREETGYIAKAHDIEGPYKRT